MVRDVIFEAEIAKALKEKAEHQESQNWRSLLGNDASYTLFDRLAVSHHPLDQRPRTIHAHVIPRITMIDTNQYFLSIVSLGFAGLVVFGIARALALSRPERFPPVLFAEPNTNPVTEKHRKILENCRGRVIFPIFWGCLVPPLVFLLLWPLVSGFVKAASVFFVPSADPGELAAMLPFAALAGFIGMCFMVYYRRNAKLSKHVGEFLDNPGRFSLEVACLSDMRRGGPIFFVPSNSGPVEVAYQPVGGGKFKFLTMMLPQIPERIVLGIPACRSFAIPLGRAPEYPPSIGHEQPPPFPFLEQPPK